MLERRQYHDRPVRHEYVLTDKGRTSSPCLRPWSAGAIAGWPARKVHRWCCSTGRAAMTWRRRWSARSAASRSGCATSPPDSGPGTRSADGPRPWPPGASPDQGASDRHARPAQFRPGRRDDQGRTRPRRPHLPVELRPQPRPAGHPLQQGDGVAVEQRDRARLVDRRSTRSSWSTRPRRSSSSPAPPATSTARRSPRGATRSCASSASRASRPSSASSCTVSRAP